jgi:hypothetical protein
MSSLISSLFARRNTTGTVTDDLNENEEEEWVALPDLSPIPLKDTVELRRQANDEKIMQHFGISLKPKGYEVE